MKFIPGIPREINETAQRFEEKIDRLIELLEVLVEIQQTTSPDQIRQHNVYPLR